MIGPVLALVLTLTPHVQFAPGTVRFMVRMSGEMQVLCVGFESVELSQRSCRDVSDAPRVIWFTYGRLPGAEYRAFAEVFLTGARDCFLEEACTPARRVEADFRVVRVVDCDGLTPQQCRETH